MEFCWESTTLQFSQSPRVLLFCLCASKNRFTTLKQFFPTNFLTNKSFRFVAHTNLTLKSKITAENDQNSASIPPLPPTSSTTTITTTPSSSTDILTTTSSLQTSPIYIIIIFFFDDRTSCVYIFLYSRAKTK